MRLDCAPMEGITDVIFRTFHHKYFPGVDRYYTPFLSPTGEHHFTKRELREIHPDKNTGFCVVPQLLSKVAADFIWAANELHAMGYEELNLNLGCPSGTVTGKGKGCGMLADTNVLDRFLDEIFSHAPCAISVKTRLGMDEPEEFEAILEIYNQYPITELIIHPRVRSDFYRHPIRPEAFDNAVHHSKNPVSFNGGIVTAADYFTKAQQYPTMKGIMIGQGLISDPFLADKIRHGVKGDRDKLREYHDRLFEEYAQQFLNRGNAMKRMKEMWVYLISSFENGDKYRKKLLKAKTPEDFLSVTATIFQELSLLENSRGEW